ncbi:MAG: MFS transporter, partial [Alistipes sp.]|nr:MFS transporter [Alistipes sp.]
ADSLSRVLTTIDSLNLCHGFTAQESRRQQGAGASDSGWWSRTVSTPLGYWISDHFGESKPTESTSHRPGAVSVLAVTLSEAPQEGEQVVLHTTMNRGDRSIQLLRGERLTFDAQNWNQTAYMLFQADPKLTEATTTEFRSVSGNIPFAWSTTFFVLAGMFLGFSLYHRFKLPRPASDTRREQMTFGIVLREFSATFASFFRKPQAVAAIFFMLTFRFSEAQLLKLINPFLLDARNLGGLGLTTGQVGLVYGTVGILGLTIGGIIGGVTAARGGLRRWIWPMTLSMLLTSGTFLVLSFTQTTNLWTINACVFVEQFGYGFGFTAYMLYLMYYADGPQKTAHYAICTGFMALGMMIPGMFAGWLQELLGYHNFFIWVMICSIVPIVAVSLLRIDPTYGKKKNV